MNHTVVSEKWGCFLLQPRRFSDNRGFFCEIFNEPLKKFLNFQPVQENTSVSAKNVIRGLHIQYDPHAAKLVRVTSGKILDVVVDCRPHSNTFGEHAKFELDAKEGLMLYVPAGFSHGFLSVEDGTTVNYHVSQAYNPSGEVAVNPFSKSLSIDWQISENQATLSAKDSKAKNFEDILWNRF